LLPLDVVAVGRDWLGTEITGQCRRRASLHDLRCAPEAAGRWWQAVTVDV